MSSGEVFDLNERVSIAGKCCGINFMYSGADGAAHVTADRKHFFSQVDDSLIDHPLMIRIKSILNQYDQTELLNISRKDFITGLPTYMNGDWAHIFKVLVNYLLDQSKDFRFEISGHNNKLFSVNIYKMVYVAIILKYQKETDDRAWSIFPDLLTVQHFDKTSNDKMIVGLCIAILGNYCIILLFNF